VGFGVEAVLALLGLVEQQAVIPYLTL